MFLVDGLVHGAPQLVVVIACGAFAVEEHEAHVASVACALHRGVRDEEATVEDVAEL